MKLEELEQVKKDLANGVIVNKSTWAKVLEAAILLRRHMESIAEYNTDAQFFLEDWDEE